VRAPIRIDRQHGGPDPGRTVVSEASGKRPQSLKVVSIPRAIGVFLLAGLLVVSVVGALLAWAQHRTATAEAIRDARTLTNLEASDVIGPLLTDAALRPGPEQDALDAVVRRHVLGTRIVRVKVWDGSGTVLYSDDHKLIGQHFPLGTEDREVLGKDLTTAEVSDLTAAENVDEKQFGKLLQVYRGFRTPEGTPLLLETYQPYSVIDQTSQRMWLSSLPILFGGLVLLYVLQAPLAYRMARRLRRSQEEREALLVGALAASDRERAQIAADLHDGVVQGLAGTSFTLAAEADRVDGVQPEAARAMRSAAGDLRRWVRELRSLLVTIVPPALRTQGLAASLGDLAGGLESRGIAVTVDVDDVGRLDTAKEGLLYRAAQEALRNVTRHADATAVTLRLTRDGDELLLTVRDNGRGLGSGPQDARRRGSVGLELLGQLVVGHGGRLTVADAEEGGVLMTVALPADAVADADLPVAGTAAPAGAPR
jgi:signal transduction histidine kinase